MFITLEGPEGSGKTSHILPLVDFLRDQGYTVFASREPGGTKIGEQIRSVLHDMRNEEMSPSTETLLYLAARAQFVAQVVKTRIGFGEVIISDRYSDSTLAYQGFGHGQDLGVLELLLNYASEGIKPDLTFLLDIEVAVGLERKERGREWNRLDAYDIEFHKRVRKGYLDLVKRERNRWIVIDANQSWDVVQQELKDQTIAKLKKAS